MPFERANAFVDKIHDYIKKIEEMIYKKDDMAHVFSASKGTEPSNLLFALEKMKYFYRHSQSLEEKRSKLSEDIFFVLDQKEQLNHHTLKKITNSFKNPIEPEEGGHFKA
jgi:hypothetical protein